MTTNLFVIANVKQLRTGGSFGILLPFFRTSCGLSLARFWRAFGISGGGELNPPTPPLRYATACTSYSDFY